MTIDDIIEHKISVTDISDEKIIKMSYAIEYFEFWGVQPQENLLYWRETRKVLMERLKFLKTKDVKEEKQKSFSAENELSVQLWEECHFCGNEPIYLSHGCCENCARKGCRY